MDMLLTSIFGASIPKSNKQNKKENELQMYRNYGINLLKSGVFSVLFAGKPHNFVDCNDAKNFIDSISVSKGK